MYRTTQLMLFVRDNIKSPDGGKRRMDNYVKITRLLYLQTEVIKAIQRVAGMPAASIAVFSQCNWRTVNCWRKRTERKERAEAAERNVEWMEQMVVRAKGKQNSTHDSHVVTAAPGRRKKIGLYLLHFGRLPLPSFLLFHSGACIDSEPSKFNERMDARRKLRDTTLG